MSAYSDASQHHAARLAVCPLARYVLAATLVRAADAAGAVGIVLLAASPATHLAGGARAGGLLAAGFTAPHLLGPIVARRLDAARDGRVVLAAAFTTYAAALGCAAILLGRAPVILAGAAIVVAGTCGPLLTGGLSSRLRGVATARGRGGARAEGWDAVTYGIAGSAGPAAVAAVAALTTPRAALLVLSASAGAAAAVTLTLPAEPSRARRTQPLRARAALRAMAARGPLRRVGGTAMLTDFGGGAMSVVAVLLAVAVGSRPGAGATLVAAFGLGNLAGALLVAAFPQRGEPERRAVRWAAVVAAGFGVCALAPSYPLALAAFALAGAPNAPYVAATLAARSEYAPSGARAQVFVAMASAKTAMGSAGAALAGAVAGAGPRVLLAGFSAVALTAVAAACADRRREATGRSGGAAPSRAAPPRQPGRTDHRSEGREIGPQSS